MAENHGDVGLDRLLREQYSLVRAVCWRILRDDADADDATQNALISIARSYAAFDYRSSVSTWVYRIATNAALDELRRRRRRSIPIVADRLADRADPRAMDEASAFESRDALGAALSQVPEEFRVPLILRDVADLDYEEISKILGIPPGTVRSRISRGRSRLAQAWFAGQGNQEGDSERPNHAREDGAHDST